MDWMIMDSMLPPSRCFRHYILLPGFNWRPTSTSSKSNFGDVTGHCLMGRQMQQNCQ